MGNDISSTGARSTHVRVTAGGAGSRRPNMGTVEAIICSLADQEKTAPLGNVVFFIHVEIREIAKAIFISSVALLNALISHCTRLKCRIVFLE